MGQRDSVRLPDAEWWSFTNCCRKEAGCIEQEALFFSGVYMTLQEHRGVFASLGVLTDVKKTKRTESTGLHLSTLIQKSFSCGLSRSPTVGRFGAWFSVSLYLLFDSLSYLPLLRAIQLLSLLCHFDYGHLGTSSSLYCTYTHHRPRAGFEIN